MDTISIDEQFPIGERVVVPYIVNDTGQTEFGTVIAHMIFQGKMVTGVAIRMDNGRIQRFEDSTFFNYLERLD